MDINHTIESVGMGGVYFTLTGKKNGDLLVDINKTENIEEQSKNTIMNEVFSVLNITEFFDFVINHPLVKDSEREGSFYVFAEQSYKKIVKLLKKQAPFFDNNDEIEEFIPKKININKGYKIQKYTLDGVLLKTYNGIRETSREEAISDTTLKSAIANRAIYLGHRWLYLTRNLPDDTVQPIGESTNVNKQKQRLVAMLDIDKKRIVEIFTNQTTASVARRLKSSSAIYQSIMRDTISSGHYFKYYDECSSEMCEDFVKNGGVVPQLNINKGICVKQLDHITGEVIKEYPNMLDIQKKFQLSNKYIRNAILTGEILKGYKWSR